MQNIFTVPIKKYEYLQKKNSKNIHVAKKKISAKQARNVVNGGKFRHSAANVFAFISFERKISKKYYNNDYDNKIILQCPAKLG